MATLLTQMLFLGIVAASLIFLSAYGGMVSLAQVSIYGVAGFALGNLTTNGNTKGLNLGWAEAPAIVVALIIAVIVAFVFGALASRSYGIYFLMITLVFSVIANLFFGQVTSVSGFGGISGIPIPDFLSRTAHPDRLYFVTLAVALLVYATAALRRADAVRADAAGHPRRPGADELAGLQRHAAPDAGVRLRRLHRRDRRRSSSSGGTRRSRRRRSA